MKIEVVISREYKMEIKIDIAMMKSKLKTKNEKIRKLGTK